MEPAPVYKTLLEGELVRRCEKNPQYSLRAFARAMSVDAGALSRILNDKICPGPRLAQKIIDGLDLSPDQQRSFLSSIERAYGTRRARKLKPEFERATTDSDESVRELSLESFRAIADWYHYAILELTFVQGFQSDPAWIANRLGISAIEARVAIGRLLRLGLLMRQGKNLKKATASIMTSERNRTSSAHRLRQKQVLSMALASLENDPIEERDTSAMTMAIDPEKLPQAKRLIHEFSVGLCRFLEEGPRKRVYELSVSLFPIQKRSSRK